MGFRADFAEDTPSASKTKRVLFYAAGLKIYGLLPHFLNRRVGGQFISHEYAGSMVIMTCPTFEQNYTIVHYIQRPAAAQGLLEWLYADAGFQWAIALDFFATDLLHINWMRYPPGVWHSHKGIVRPGFSKVLQGLSEEVSPISILKALEVQSVVSLLPDHQQ